MNDKEKIALYEDIFKKLYTNRNVTLNVERMKEVLDAIDFWARFDDQVHKGSQYQAMKALNI